MRIALVHTGKVGNDEILGYRRIEFDTDTVEFSRNSRFVFYVQVSCKILSSSGKTSWASLHLDEIIADITNEYYVEEAAP